MSKNIGQLTESEAKAHLTDLEKLSVKLYREFRKEIAKHKFYVDFFAPQSLAQLFCFLIVVAAEDMSTSTKGAAVDKLIYDYISKVMINLRDGIDPPTTH